MNCTRCGQEMEPLLFRSLHQALSYQCKNPQCGEPPPAEEPAIEANLEGYLEWCAGALRQRSAWGTMPLRLEEYLSYEEVVRGFSPDRSEMELQPLREDDVTYGLLLVWTAQTLGPSRRKGAGASLRQPPVLTEEGQWIFPGRSLVTAAQRVAREFSLGDRWSEEVQILVRSRLVALTEGRTIEEVARRLRWGQRWDIWYQTNFQREIDEQVARSDRLAETQDLILAKVRELLLTPTAKRITDGENGEKVTILPHKDWSPRLVPELMKTHAQIQELERQQAGSSIEEPVLALCEMGLVGDKARSSVHAAVAKMREEIRESLFPSAGEGTRTIDTDSTQIL